jgi:hypothetical protein
MKFAYYVAVMEMLLSPLLALCWIVIAVLSLTKFINTSENEFLLYTFVAILIAYICVMVYKILHNKILPKLSTLLARRKMRD